MNPLRKIKALEEQRDNLERLLEDNNEERQEWKQMCYTLANILYQVKDEVKVSEFGLIDEILHKFEETKNRLQ